MQPTNPNQAAPDTRLSLEQIWQVGCSKGALSEHDWQHFIRMARNRFYTLVLGLEHAAETRQSEHSSGLEKGFVTELMASPGLEAVWQASEFRQTKSGKSIAKQLRRRAFNSRFRIV